jgi:hypothetical protein
MIKQTIFPFKLEISNEKITAHAGLVLVAEAAESVGLPSALESEFPTPLSEKPVHC